GGRAPGRIVLAGPGTKWTHLRRDLVVAMHARDFFDEVDLAEEVRAPARNVDGDPAIVGLGDHGRPNADKTAFDLGPGEVDAEDLRDACRAQEDARRMDRHGNAIHRRTIHLPTGDR